MNEVQKSLVDLGFDEEIEANIDSMLFKTHELARVVSVHKDSYLVSKGNSNVFAELAGKFRYSAESPLDLPTTGDWVYVDFFDEDHLAIIHDIVKRKNLLRRKTSGRKIDYQLVAANIDLAFIIQSLDDNFNPRRLERYLAMANDGGVGTLFLLSKSDLLSDLEIENKIDAIRKEIGPSEVIAFSNEDKNKFQKITDTLKPAKTYCLMGSSGVGKTTLLNNLVGGDFYQTNSVREKDNRGKHTTTSRQLVVTPTNAIVIDTPGMRELGNISIDSSIDETFNDISDLIAHCKFNNCTHENEIGCAVLEAINDGSLSQKRYQNYLKMKKETAFNEMSYFDKRRKDKELGKFYKSVLKSKQR